MNMQEKWKKIDENCNKIFAWLEVKANAEREILKLERENHKILIGGHENV